MKSTKKITAIILTSACLCQNLYAMKRSRSYPEVIPTIPEKTASSPQISTYELNRYCDQIFINADYLPLEDLITYTLDLCQRTFTQLKKILGETDSTTNSFYLNNLASYMNLVKKINTIIFENILESSEDSEDIDEIEPPSIPNPDPKTKIELNDTFFTVASTLKKYEHTFMIPLTYKLPNCDIINKMHEKMYNTWYGLWVIMDSDDFKN